MITYATRKECLAAIKTTGLAATHMPYGLIVEGVEQFEIREKAAPVANPAKSVKGKPLPTLNEAKAAAKGKAVEGIADAVAVTELGVCARVQAYANANPTMTRKDVIAAMVAAGVHKATASIQCGKADAKAGRVRA
ncbi:hypothetical protein [Mesorhizobium sp.]|uniref:hypothetical protein n=1 Tax=Mesorhizobium sp. TaxID=1871066 RepID=UPI000FE9764C|nr:hypothetical protein [Mesorhizobium sp.]RWO89542.1 MAG: hypothetical protein EOQ96_05120 [Mesorhizobium sp.]